MKIEIEIPDSFAVSHSVDTAESSTHPLLTAGEMSMLADILSQAVVKKYLQVMAFNSLKDSAEIPLTTMAEDGLTVFALKQAYVKGGLSILHTLLTIQKPQSTSVQANQGQQNTPR